MILDDGICTIFRQTDVSEPGGKPVMKYAPIFRSWFGFLAFETNPARPTDGRQEMRIDARIRIEQNPLIRQNDVCILQQVDEFDYSLQAFKITRAYHGQDDDGPTLISDLTLEVMEP